MSRRLLEFAVGPLVGPAIEHAEVREQPDGSVVITTTEIGPDAIQAENFPRWVKVRSACLVVELVDTGGEN